MRLQKLLDLSDILHSCTAIFCRTFWVGGCAVGSPEVLRQSSRWSDWYQYYLAVVVCVPQAPQIAYFIVLFWVPTAYVISSLKSPLLEVECKLKGRSLQPSNFKKVVQMEAQVSHFLVRRSMLEMNWKKIFPTMSSLSFVNCYIPPGHAIYWFLVHTWVHTVIQDGCLGNHACPSRPNIGGL